MSADKWRPGVGWGRVVQQGLSVRKTAARPHKTILISMKISFYFEITVLHPMDSLERMYSPSIAMYPSKCVRIHASVPQCTST